LICDQGNLDSAMMDCVMSGFTRTYSYIVRHRLAGLVKYINRKLKVGSNLKNIFSNRVKLTKTKLLVITALLIWLKSVINYN